jgi:hypothetical protein
MPCFFSNRHMGRIRGLPAPSHDGDSAGTRGRGFFGCCALVGYSALGGCTGLDSGADSLPADGVGMDELSLSPDWSCIDAPPPRPARNPPAFIEYAVPIVDWVTQEHPQGLTIALCSDLDPTCRTPALPPVQPPQARLVELQVPGGFQGYLHMTAGDRIPERFYFDTVLDTDQEGDRIQMLFLATLVDVASLVGVAPMPGRALVVLRSHDCTGSVISGATFTINAPGSAYTLLGNTPVLESVPTDGAGLGGFVNVEVAVPAGSVVTAEGYLEDGTLYGRNTFLVLPDIITIAEVRPPRSD